MQASLTSFSSGLSTMKERAEQLDKPSQQTTPPSTPLSDYANKATQGLDVEKLHGPFSQGIDGYDRPLVAVLGCGYVGSQLLNAFSKHYHVLGYDISNAQLEQFTKQFQGDPDRISVTSDPRVLAKATHFLVAVPTLVQADRSIDTSFVRAALATVASHALPGSTVVVESSVAIGMTRRLLGPLASSRRLFAGMSPERVDPGRTDPPLEMIPKILAGLDDVVPGSLDAITQLYSPVFETIYPVSRPEVAEMTKLYENCQRMMGIAFANEMADACIPHDIDPYEVCRAAATKPFGYMAFEPSLGPGGHCIPVNPWYLLSNGDYPLLRAATEKMEARPAAIGKRVARTLADAGLRGRCHHLAKPDVARKDSGVDMSADYSAKRLHVRDEKADSQPLSGSQNLASRQPHTTNPRSGGEDGVPEWLGDGLPRVLVVGVGFKRGQSNLSNSAGLRLVQCLAESGCFDVAFADALVSQSAVPHVPRLSMDQWDREHLEKFDMIIVSFRQSGMDFGILDELSDNVRVEKWCQ